MAYPYISADSHFECPPEVWKHRVPEPYRDRVARSIKLANGNDAIVREGSSLIYGGTSLYAGWSPEEFSPARLDYARSAGTGTPQERLAEQDADGVAAEVLYAITGAAGGVRNTALGDPKALLEIVKGFNDYFAEEYCAVDPARLIGVGVLPDIGAEEDVAEAKRCTDLGLKAVCLSTFPSGKTFPTAEDDLFWAAAVDMGLAVNIHTGFPHRSSGREASYFAYPKQGTGLERVPADFLERMVRHGIHHCGALEALQLVLFGVFDRFPDLRIYWAENNIGWIPYFYEQIDMCYQRNHYWAERDLGVAPLKELPSDYLKQHAIWGYWDDPIGIELRHKIGVDNIMWSTDFPHVVTNWPNSVKATEEQLADVPEDERYRLVAGNAIDFFHLDDVYPAA